MSLNFVPFFLRISSSHSSSMLASLPPHLTMNICCRSRTVLHFKTYLVLILGLAYVAYAAALPVTGSEAQLNSRSQLVHRAVWKAGVEFRRGGHHELPSGVGEPSSDPGQIESAITDAIHQRFGPSVPVTFVKHGETPD
ncbi:hypothetical protein EV359DRAFT_82591 [Lentinula novae-zelandiae]|nr:hypothetical protein EV359DRAFT_82591 [Lentinula novae-zelandiae]